jgi:hypothetical protein
MRMIAIRESLLLKLLLVKPTMYICRSGALGALTVGLAGEHHPDEHLPHSTPTRLVGALERLEAAGFARGSHTPTPLALGRRKKSASEIAVSH